MQTSPNREKVRIYYGYNCHCCAIDDYFFKYRANRAKYKEDEYKEIEEWFRRPTAESIASKAIQCQFESDRDHMPT
jgi:hypothetical protein